MGRLGGEVVVGAGLLRVVAAEAVRGRDQGVVHALEGGALVRQGTLGEVRATLRARHM